MKLVRVIILIAILAGVVAAVSLTLYGWILGQTIFISTYNVKAGVNYWATWTLNNNIFTASLLLAILSSLITLWTRSTFLSFVSAMTQTGPSTPIKLDQKTAFLWRALEFGG
ncbi:MAG: hypothetical protein ACTSPB_24550, partial [Candidatus Thorarchaeota archaeon]